MSDMRSEPSCWTYLVLLIQFGILPYSPNSLPMAWFTDFLYSPSQHVALNRIMSSPLPVKAKGVPQGSVLSSNLFLIFINDLSDCLENPLYLFADEPTLCHDISPPPPLLTDRQAATYSLSSDNNKITSWSNTWNTVRLNPEKSHTISICLCLCLSLSERTVLQNLTSTVSTTLSKKSSHSNSWVSLSVRISLEQTTFQSWPLNSKASR